MLEVIHSPRLEDLADQLAEQLRAQRRRQRENILQPIAVVVGHLGIARWLEQRIAARFGIFANVRFLLPGEWLNAEMARFGVQEEQEAARFSIGAMTWALYALLDAPERFGLADARLLERERFQLAARLARLFGEYLIYRREWLLDFEQLNFEQQAARPLRADTAVEAKAWQARLWCAMSARLKGQHRATKFHALLNAIQNRTKSGATIDAPIYFFGLNHLPPDVLTLLERLSESVSVQIYFPNPCVEYWADVVRERFLVQRRLGGDLLSAGTDDPGGFDHFDVGHPLLASLGGHGQAYFAELSHATEQFTEVASTQAPPEKPTLLAALQYGISHLQPDFAPTTLRFDHSIQLVSANGIVDELNQVKAILFDALIADPGLRLEEIAIMTPNISRYAPLLPAVFGLELCASPPFAIKQDPMALPSGPRAQSALRYSVLDLTPAIISPLLTQLLEAPELRWEPAQLLALLTLDEVAQHFALDANDLKQAPRLLQRAHIAFGFNDAHRRQLIAAPVAPNLTDVESGNSLHTWEAGLERLIFGYLHGNQSELHELESLERLWPAPDIDVRHTRVLTALLQVIRALRIFNFGAQHRRTLPEWTRWLERQFVAFTGATAPDSVRALFTQLELDARHAELVDELSFVALREACNTRAAQINRRSTPALGAICVCGLVPMRALPFKVICILGLNEAEFPKPETPDSLNLMRAIGARRPGDRSRVQEDRYLFLEAIMAARSTLVLSYQGITGDGKTRSPCGVLAELLAQLQRQFSARQGNKYGAGAPWIYAKTPTAVPNADQMRQNVELLVKPCGIVAASISPAISPTSTAMAQSKLEPPPPRVLKTDELLRFWQQPLRSYVQQRLRVAHKHSDSDPFADARSSEPLSLTTLPIERIEARLLAHALAAASFPTEAPAWLGRSGLLPSGALGVQSYASIEDACRVAWLAIKGKFPDFIGAEKKPVRVDLNFGATRLVGHIPEVYLKQRAVVCVSSKAMHGAQRLQLLLRVLLLRAGELESDVGAPPWRALHLGPKAAELTIYASPGEAREYLANLIALRSAYLLPTADSGVHCATPPWFWAKLSYTAFSANGDPHEAVSKLIEAGNDYELANSGLKFWLPNAAFFEAGSVEFAQFLALAQTLFAPFAPPTEAVKSSTFNSLNAQPVAPPLRNFMVTEKATAETNAPSVTIEALGHEAEPLRIETAQQGSANTLDLKHFGHDDAADFEDE